MDGLEAARRLRVWEKEHNHRSKFHQPIIGMFANSDNATMNEALSAGMDDFIAKPLYVQSYRHPVYIRMITQE